MKSFLRYLFNAELDGVEYSSLLKDYRRTALRAGSHMVLFLFSILGLILAVFTKADDLTVLKIGVYTAVGLVFGVSALGKVTRLGQLEKVLLNKSDEKEIGDGVE